VQRGAIEIGRTSRVGLRKLMQVAGVRPPILPDDIGYRLGPRLNAAGRLSTAEKSLRLLLTNDEDEAARLAIELDQQNRARQEVEKEILSAAIVTIEKQFNAARDAAIVAGARGWHPGVLGIVASRIARKYHRPTIIIGFDEKGVGKGSGRSIAGLNLVETLTRCAATLEKFGGHEMAAGLALREEIFRNLPKRFAVRRASYFQKKLCNARCDWITSCRSQISMSNFYAGMNFYSRSETEIRSQFSLRVRSSQSGRRESQTKSISYFGCARARGIVAPSISTVWQMNFRRRLGTSHFALGWMNMAAKLWLACGSKACAQPRRLETPSSNGMTSVSTNLEDLSWIPRPRLLALRRLGIETTEDLLTHFPRRHEDRTEFQQFPRKKPTLPSVSAER